VSAQETQAVVDAIMASVRRTLPTIHKNMSLRDALEVATALGYAPRQGKGGEVVIQFDRRCLRLNSRRKDCPQVLVSLLRQVMAQDGAECA
jgi:hypothetical protein